MKIILYFSENDTEMIFIDGGTVLTGICIVLVAGLVYLLYRILKWPARFLKALVTSPVKACKWWLLTTKRTNYLKEYFQDYNDGYLTREEFDEILGEYNSRDPRIFFTVIDSVVCAPGQDVW